MKKRIMSVGLMTLLLVSLIPTYGANASSYDDSIKYVPEVSYDVLETIYDVVYDAVESIDDVVYDAVESIDDVVYDAAAVAEDEVVDIIEEVDFAVDTSHPEYLKESVKALKSGTVQDKRIYLNSLYSQAIYKITINKTIDLYEFPSTNPIKILSANSGDGLNVLGLFGQNFDTSMWMAAMYKNGLYFVKRADLFGGKAIKRVELYDNNYTYNFVKTNKKAAIYAMDNKTGEIKEKIGVVKKYAKLIATGQEAYINGRTYTEVLLNGAVECLILSSSVKPYQLETALPLPMVFK